MGQFFGHFVTLYNIEHVAKVSSYWSYRMYIVMTFIRSTSHSILVQTLITMAQGFESYAFTTETIKHSISV